MMVYEQIPAKLMAFPSASALLLISGTNTNIQYDQGTVYSTASSEKIIPTCRLQTFGEAQFLGDGACNFGSGGIAVEIHLVDAVPIHMGPTQLQTVDGCRGAVRDE